MFCFSFLVLAGWAAWPGRLAAGWYWAGWPVGWLGAGWARLGKLAGLGRLAAGLGWAVGGWAAGWAGCWAGCWAGLAAGRAGCWGLGWQLIWPKVSFFLFIFGIGTAYNFYLSCLEGLGSRTFRRWYEGGPLEGTLLALLMALIKDLTERVYMPKGPPNPNS